MRISKRWNAWANTIIGGSISTVIGGLILYYIRGTDPENDKPSPTVIEVPPPDDHASTNENVKDLPIRIIPDSSSSPDGGVTIPPQIPLTPNYIESCGVGEDMFDAEQARTQARKKALSDLINIFPGKEQLIRRYAKIIRDTVIILDRGVYRAQIVMQIDKHWII